MDNQESETPAPIFDIENKQSNYELTFNNDTFLLTIETTSEETIKFKIRQSNNISFYYYEKTYNYEEIAKILLLEKNFYNSINKILRFYDKALTNNQVSLTQNKEKKIMILSLKKKMDFDEVECLLYLLEMKITNEEMITILFNEIKEMKLNKIKKEENIINNINNNINNNENNELIKKLIKKNEELELKMNSIIDENIKLRNNISELQNSINELRQKNKNEEKEKYIEGENKFKRQFSEINFYGNPENLDFHDCLTNMHSKSGWLRSFAVYTRLTDNVEYLAYGNKNTNNIDIIKIEDKKLYHYFKGHKDKISMIRYFSKNTNYELLLSCDESRFVFGWDVQSNSQKFMIHTNFSGYIWDALILFDIYDKNYLFVPSNCMNESTRAYEIREICIFSKNIVGTNDNKTNYLIPWYYNKNYYLIECCSSKISINNILIDENYATLKNDPEGLHCCGIIYNNNFLCVTDYNNNFIRIWDLINKSIYKTIAFDANLAYGIISWNDTYIIVSCSGCFVIIDLKQNKIINKISFKSAKASFCGLKKIKTNKLGECIICSDTNNNIRLFNLKKI